jgi:hypothetical protein
MGSGRSRHGVTGVARWVGRVAVVLGLGFMVTGVVAPPAGANYGRIAAEARCDRNVTWAASASTEGSPAERTNQQVLVEYRDAASDTESEWIVAEAEGRFDEANDFTFAGTFELPEGVDEVQLRVSPQVAWGPNQDGDEPGAPRFASAALPSTCAEQPLVATVALDCAAGGAVVALHNVGDDPLDVTVAADRVDLRELEMSPGGESALVVPVLDRTSSAIRVQSGDVVVAQEEVRSDCGAEGAAAVVIERCAARQAVVLAGTDGAGGEVQIRAAGAIVHRAELSADQVLQRTLELPAEGTVPVEVSVDGQVVSQGALGGCAAAVTGAATCGTPGRPSCQSADSPAVPPPPPPPPPLTVELDGSELAHTGPWQRAVVLLLGGALLAGGGAALVLEQRRRPRPSLLSSLVAPYRQRWWTDL